MKHRMVAYIILTERLGLRKCIDADFLPFAKMNKDINVMEHFQKHYQTKKRPPLINKISMQFAKHGFALFAVEKLATKEFIGFTGFMIPSFESFVTPCIEIGWRIKMNGIKVMQRKLQKRACIMDFKHCHLKRYILLLLKKM